MFDMLLHVIGGDGAAPHAHDSFLPHGTCYLWDPWLLGLQVLSDIAIGAAYVSISLTLLYLVYRARRDIPFQGVFVAFGLFIIACGITHFMKVWTIWNPDYWAEGAVKAVTAVASVLTAVALPAFVPRTLALVEAARVSEQRKARLEQTHSELSTLYARLKELDQIKTQFFANVSHELRTPLTLILGPAKKLADDRSLGEQQRHDVTVIERNARTLLRHINDLLDVAKLEAGRMTPSYATVDLVRLLHVTAAHFESLAQERMIVFTVDAPDSLPAEADPEKLQKVLLNLLSNAFKFTPDRGRVRCTLRATDGHATLTVGDSGPGVPPELRAAIFERFRQGDGGLARRFGGTGLGLAIAKEFVELHGGTIAVEDAPEGGALFRVTLPLRAPLGAAVAAADGTAAAEAVPADAAQEIVRHSRPAVAPAPADASSRNGEEGDRPARAPLTGEPGGGQEASDDRPLVLVVEDNPEMNRFISDALAADYRTLTALDGQEGLALALAAQPDLILSDVMMPHLSGDQMLAALRTHPELEGTPVVLLTAKTDDDLRVQLLRTGAQDYLTKPFSVEELRARVDNMIAIKRTRELLQREVAVHSQDVATLAGEVAAGKRAAEAERRRLQAVLEQIPVGVVIVNAPDGDVLLSNTAAQHILRRPVEPAMGAATAVPEVRLRPSGEPFPVEEWPVMRALRRGETVLDEEMVLDQPDAGQRITILVSAAPVSDEQGQPIAAVAVFQDITARKTLEQQKDEFMALAAHELKTPLTAIKGNTQILLRRIRRGERTLGDRDLETLEAINERASHMAGLVEDLLDLSRIATGRLTLHPAPADLAALLRDTVRQHQTTHPDRVFVLTGAAGEVPGEWDRTRLEQVISNLLDNAVKYSPPGSPIAVGLEVSGQDGGQVHLTVSDRGIGIPAADLPYIFERHHRAGNVGLAPAGLGLGLYLSSQIVQRHGGRIWAESAEGQGSTFHVTLPVRAAAAAA